MVVTYLYTQNKVKCQRILRLWYGSTHKQTNRQTTIYYPLLIKPRSVADPGFPIGGRGPIRGVWTPDMGTFRQNCMPKRKNWVP